MGTLFMGSWESHVQMWKLKIKEPVLLPKLLNLPFCGVQDRSGQWMPLAWEIGSSVFLAVTSTHGSQTSYRSYVYLSFSKACVLLHFLRIWQYWLSHIFASYHCFWNLAFFMKCESLINKYAVALFSSTTWTFIFLSLWIIITRYALKKFIWLCWVLIVVCECEISSWGMWNLVPWPGIKPRPLALGAWNLSHWITREVPRYAH